MKEVYLVNYVATGASKSKLRIELYYNSGDTDRAILGVDTTVVYLSGATETVQDIVSPYAVSEAEGAVTMSGWNEATSATDFVRLSAMVRQEDGTLTLHCDDTVGNPDDTVCGAADSVDKSYTYEGDEVVSAADDDETAS